MISEITTNQITWNAFLLFSQQISYSFKSHRVFSKLLYVSSLSRQMAITMFISLFKIIFRNVFLIMFFALPRYFRQNRYCVELFSVVRSSLHTSYKIAINNLDFQLKCMQYPYIQSQLNTPVLVATWEPSNNYYFVNTARN